MGVCGLLFVCPSVAVAEHERHEVRICHGRQITLGDRISGSSVMVTLSYRATVRCARSKAEICRRERDADPRLRIEADVNIRRIGYEDIVVDVPPGSHPRLPGECQQLPGAVEWIEHRTAHKSAPFGESELQDWALRVLAVSNPNIAAQARDFDTLAVSEAA